MYDPSTVRYSSRYCNTPLETKELKLNRQSHLSRTKQYLLLNQDFHGLVNNEYHATATSTINNDNPIHTYVYAWSHQVLRSLFHLRY